MKIDKNEISEKVKQFVKNGVRNRNKILSSLLSKDEQIMKVLELYKKGKSEADILVELKMPIEDVRKNMETIDNVSKMIDSTINWITARKFFMNKVIADDMPRDNDEELRKSLAKVRKEITYKRKNARFFLNKYFHKYQFDMKAGLVDKNQILKDLPNLVKKVELLGCQTSDVLYLVSLYDEVGDYKRAENILKVFDPQKMSETEEKNYYILKDSNKKLRNKKFIENLSELGYSPKQIYEFCEKEVSEYRAPYLDLKFIASVLEEYSKKTNNTTKSNENKEKSQPEDDELEL